MTALGALILVSIAIVGLDICEIEARREDD